MALSPVLRLASASPRRRELLAQIGVPHAIAAPDVDERARHGEAVAAYVERLARAKAETVWQRQRDLPVLGADTTVVLDGVSLGKPEDRAHGLAQIERARMQRGGGAAGGVGELGHVHVDRAVQQIEAEAERAVDPDLRVPRQV